LAGAFVITVIGIGREDNVRIPALHSLKVRSSGRGGGAPEREGLAGALSVPVEGAVLIGDRTADRLSVFWMWSRDVVAAAPKAALP
jgi:hypothetical protein